MEYEERKASAQIIRYLEKILLNALPGNGDFCSCMDNEEEPEPYHVVHHGNLFNEIKAYCLRCGGIWPV